MSDKRCIKCKKILVGNHLLLCSNCKRKVSKGLIFCATGAAAVALKYGREYIKFKPKINVK